MDEHLFEGELTIATLIPALMSKNSIIPFL